MTSNTPTNIQSSYSEIISFRELLNNIESQVQEEIRTLSGDGISTIGVSIQLLAEEQDENTPTRGQKADINGFCRGIQETNCASCDKFDVQAKSFAKEKKRDQKTILFNCHANVTNFLIPFVPQVAKFTYEGPIFYIFLGHFLLEEPLTAGTIDKRNIHVFDKVKDLVSNEAEDFNLINDFKAQKIPYSNPEHLKDENVIATSSAHRYLEIQDKALELIQQKLVEHDILTIDKDAKRIFESKKLERYRNRTEPGVIKGHLEKLQKSISKSDAISKEDQKQYLDVISKLIIQIDISSSKINDAINNELNNHGKDRSNLFLFLTLEEGNNLKTSIEEIYCEFSLDEVNKFVSHFSGIGFGNSLWKNSLSSFYNSMKDGDGIKNFEFKSPSKRFSNASNITKYFLGINSKFYEYTGVLLFAVSGNFLYNILDPNSITGNIHLLYFVLFWLSGYLWFLFSFKKELLDKDSFNDESIDVSNEEYIFNRLSKKDKWYLFVPIALILLSFLFRMFSGNQQTSADLSKSIFFTDENKFYETHDSVGLLVFDEFGVEQGLFKQQAEIIISTIEGDSLSKLNIVDAGCVLGRSIFEFNQLNKNPNAFIKGCYEHPIVLEKSDLIKVDTGVLIHSPWDNLSSKFNRNSINLISLFNNSIETVHTEDNLSSLLLQYNDLLTDDGVLIIDIDTCIATPCITSPPLGVGIKRLKDVDPITKHKVSFYNVDPSKHPMEKLLYSGNKHNVNMSDENLLCQLLKKNGFKSVEFINKKGYPFKVCIAKK